MEVSILNTSTGTTCTVELDQDETLGTLKQKAVDRLITEGEAVQTDALGLRLKGTTAWLGADDTPVEGTAVYEGCVVEAVPGYKPPGCTDEFGGDGGGAFDDASVAGSLGRVVGVNVGAGNFLDSVELVYSSGKGLKHGGNGGLMHNIRFDHDEYVTGVRMTHAGYCKSISFVTNKTTHGPFGKEWGSVFTADFGITNELLYLFGRQGALIDALGFAYGHPDMPTA
eukprot:TRINITY_DN2278_c0_g3_i1.p1 TRINITY_DN2278_c0_g3~~TRINITY_DN2278_c0_g3_i1.p1  ORF type:complete len:243 (+),score=73.23 TRINITY_DN2278_c0_g3_i1:54-731(+)